MIDRDEINRINVQRIECNRREAEGKRWGDVLPSALLSVSAKDRIQIPNLS